MATTVSISSELLKSLTSGEWSGHGVKGFLIGGLESGSLEPRIVQGVWQSKLIDTNELKEDIEECLQHFPGGKYVVGAVLLPSPESIKSFEDGDEEGIEGEFETAFDSFSFWLEQMGLSQAIVLCLWQHSKSDEYLKNSFFYMTEDKITRTNVNHDVDIKSVTRLRLKADIPLLISTESNSEDQIQNALDHELMKLQNQVQAGGFVFGLDDNKIIMQEKDAIIGSAAQSWTTCSDIAKYIAEQKAENTPVGGGRKRTVGLQQQVPVPVSLLQMSYVESPEAVKYAPIIRHHIGSFKTTKLNAPFDVLTEVEDNMPVSELPVILRKAVARQISAIFQCLSLYTQKSKLHTPEVFHFKPSGLDTPVTVVYPKGASEKELESERQILHRSLCLPASQPLLRRAASGFFLQQTAPGGYLLNVHIGLSDPPVKSATLAMVHGYYSYHHYMQDHFDDDKWGCAYRSLQTIVSWFKYQGYTEKDIPSHRDIQQALFEVGDKEQKFVGSKQWIGSFEVSFVLDHLLGVSSKFINVNAGSELSSAGQQLANHFQTQRTPVMIGGGVLAHTILGVAYSEVTGDISFLILDPHYTGGEDIRTIQDKGWCGWKDMNFWNQTAHYNLCLPQRPLVI